MEGGRRKGKGRKGVLRREGRTRVGKVEEVRGEEKEIEKCRGGKRGKRKR